MTAISYRSKNKQENQITDDYYYQRKKFIKILFGSSQSHMTTEINDFNCIEARFVLRIKRKNDEKHHTNFSFYFSDEIPFKTQTSLEIEMLVKMLLIKTCVNPTQWIRFVIFV